jgi:hypothetical protein
MINDDRTSTYQGIRSCGDWKFRAYVTKHKSRLEREIDIDILSLVKNFHLDIEYNEWFFGFFIIHFGRRGDNILFFHVGTWGNTIEIFHQSYYKSLLDTEISKANDADPICCVHDISILAHEISLLKKAASIFNNSNEIRDYYLKMPNFFTKNLT